MVEKITYIYSYNGNNWFPYLVPSAGCVIVSREDSSIYVKDSIIKKFITIGSSNGNSSGNNLINEKLILSSTNIANKSLTLLGNIARGQENNVICFVGGTVQFAGTDFTASGDTISWNNKTIDTCGLKAGDTVVVQYTKA